MVKPLSFKASAANENPQLDFVDTSLAFNAANSTLSNKGLKF